MAAQVQSALDDMHQWLDGDDQAPGWKKYLESARLQLQLDRGAQADPQVVAEILRQYESNTPGLDSRNFVNVRVALRQWLAELSFPPVEELPAMCTAAKETFTPLTDADVEEAKSELLAAVDRLDTRLNDSPSSSAPWKTFLRWDVMQSQLSDNDSLDLSVLNSVYQRYAANHAGLELPVFADVRQALRRYLLTAQIARDAEATARYEAWLDTLAGHLEAYGTSPNGEQADRIGAALAWLEDARRAPALVEAVRYYYSRPNLWIEVSADLIGAGVTGPFEETTPISDTILGTSLSGTDRTTGRVTIELIPSADRATVDIVLQGMTESQSVGINGPARIHSTGTSQIRARKRLLIDAEGLEALPAESYVETSTTINNVTARGIARVQREARSRTYQQKSRGEQIAAQHAEQRINRRMDTETGRLVARANQAFVEKFRQPLLRQRAFPQVLRFSTTKQTLNVMGLQADRPQLGAPSAPPELIEPTDLSARVHESLVNNLAKSLFAGQHLTEVEFWAILGRLLGGLPQPVEQPEETEPWAVTFAQRAPLSVTFADDGFVVTLRGQTFFRGAQQLPAMNVTLTYKIMRTDQGFSAVLQGRPQIFPSGFIAGGNRRLSVREQALRSLLERRLATIIDQQWSPPNLRFPGAWSKAGKLSLVHWQTTDGWMLLGWKRTQSALATTAGDATAPPASPSPPWGPPEDGTPPVRRPLSKTAW
jgi:hypothetical protein